MKRILVLLARLALGGIFFYAGYTKLGQPLEFARSIAAYDLLPYNANILLGVVLPWIECIVGVLLIVGWKVRPMAALTTLFLFVFLTGLISAMARGLSIDCGCFELGKSTDPPPLWTAVVRDVGFLLLSIAVWFSAYRRAAALSQSESQS